MTEIERWVRHLGDPGDATDVVRLGGDGWTDLDPNPTYAAYTGIAHLLMARGDADDLGRHLGALEANLLSYEGRLHYKAYEVTSRAEQLERVARMQRTEVRATRDWLIPRLERDIAMYEARVRALEEAIAHDG